MAAPPPPPAQPLDLLRARLEHLCDHALARCRGLQNPQQIADCIDQEKRAIKERFVQFPAASGIVENYNWNLPAQGGKRKSTRKSKRRKNTRKNRHSSLKF